MNTHSVSNGNGTVLSEDGRLNREPPAMMALAFGVVLLLAVAIGYVAANKSLITVIAIPAIAGVTYMTFKSPRAGLVLLLIFTSTLIAPEFLFALNPKNVYNAYEGMLIMVIVSSMMAAARLRQRQGLFERFYSSPVAIALTVFAVVVLIKALTLIIESRFAPGTISQMNTFNRSLSLYLLFIPALLLFDTPKKQRWLVMVFFALGGVVLTRVMLELMFPSWSLFQMFSVAQPLADETPTVDMSVLRLRAPGGTFMLVCFWIGLMNIALRSWSVRRLALYIPVTLMMLVGILLEFNRSYVIPMMVLFVVALFLNRERVRAKLLTMVIFVLLVAVILLFTTTLLNSYVDAGFVRYGSTFSSESLESQSVLGREIEQQYAWVAIQRAPLFGIALDEFYRPPVPEMLDNLRWYIHNSYIWIWTYFGLVGLASFLFVLAAAILRSFLNWQRIRDPFLQTVVLGFAFSLVTLMSANIVAPKFYDFAAVPVVALMLGLMEAIIISSRQEAESGHADA
ncbi:MAG: O-antigen ligase family protein [Chloroflexi bacterium]|nr:O-antigen ligase family protein [Chloroflexota bacterium]